MKEITLTKGLFAIVDDDQFEKLSQFKWQACPKKGKFYAVRMLPRDGQPRRRITMHHQIYGFVPTGFQIDHRNGNSLDNRRRNLRIATQSQQSQNSKLRRDNILSTKGVSKNYGSGPKSKTHPYRARIQLNGERKMLGYFRTTEEAGRAYDKAARELFGEFAYRK